MFLGQVQQNHPRGPSREVETEPRSPDGREPATRAGWESSGSPSFAKSRPWMRHRRPSASGPVPPALGRPPPKRRASAASGALGHSAHMGLTSASGYYSVVMVLMSHETGARSKWQ